MRNKYCVCPLCGIRVGTLSSQRHRVAGALARHILGSRQDGGHEMPRREWRMLRGFIAALIHFPPTP